MVQPAQRRRRAWSALTAQRWLRSALAAASLAGQPVAPPSCAALQRSRWVAACCGAVCCAAGRSVRGALQCCVPGRGPGPSSNVLRTSREHLRALASRVHAKQPADRTSSHNRPIHFESQPALSVGREEAGPSSATRRSWMQASFRRTMWQTRAQYSWREKSAPVTNSISR